MRRVIDPPHGTVFASQRAAHLLQTHAHAKICAGHIDLDAVGFQQITIELELTEIERLLGVAIPSERWFGFWKD